MTNLANPKQTMMASSEFTTSLPLGRYVVTTSSSTVHPYTSNINTNSDYAIFELPLEAMPTLVFVCGKLVTLGLLGANAECAYIPATKKGHKSQLIFSPGVIVGNNNRLTVSLDYKEAVYHYNIGMDGRLSYKEESIIVEQFLISVISKHE